MSRDYRTSFVIPGIPFEDFVVILPPEEGGPVAGGVAAGLARVGGAEAEREVRDSPVEHVGQF